MNYTIKAGDTLSKIAQNNNTTVDALLAANPDIVDRNKIAAGEDIVIPDNGANTAGQGSQSGQASTVGQNVQANPITAAANTNTAAPALDIHQPAQPAGVREINQAGIDLVKRFEGIVDGDKSTPNYDAYMDPVGIWTIGYGHAIVWKGQFLKGSQNLATARQLYPGGLTLSQAEDLLRADLLTSCRNVQSVVSVNVNDNQFAALVSFTFNLGIGNLKNSTLLKKLNAGDYAGAANEFPKWNKAGGQVLAGLTKRRAAEQALFLQPM